jgi:hypothetical protein
MKEAVIVSAVRTAVGKAPKGTLRNTRPDEMGAAVIKEAMARVPGLEAAEIEDVIMGCAMPEAEQGMNIARSAAIRKVLRHRRLHVADCLYHSNQHGTRNDTVTDVQLLNRRNAHDWLHVQVVQPVAHVNVQSESRRMGCGLR